MRSISTAAIDSAAPAVCRCTREVTFPLWTVIFIHSEIHFFPNFNTFLFFSKYSPICASDNQTYNNNCEFECAKQYNDHDLSIRFYGTCSEGPKIVQYAEDLCVCPAVLSPVCGSNDQTYDNECQLKCEQRKLQGLNVKYLGECDKAIQNYTAPVIMNSTGIIMNSTVVVMNSTVTTCICTLEYSPVCANNGQTFANKCEFNCQKRSNPQLKIEYSGQCTQIDNTLAAVLEDVCACPLIYAPVCANTDKTYPNVCALNCAKKSNANLAVKFNGVCEQPQTLPVINENCICTLENRPVCGTDSQTYSNECALNCAKKTNPQLQVKYSGVCEQPQTLPVADDLCICTLEYSPVCASDNKTYSNICSLRCEQKKNPSLTVKFNGKCNWRYTYL